MTSSDTNKTVPTNVSVDDFEATLTPQRREESQACIALMREVTGLEPAMWGPSIIGFGQYHYVYESGREGDAPAVAFSPRKTNLVVYLADGVDRYPELLERLGPHSTGTSCLYIKRLSAVDAEVLRELIVSSYDYVMTELDTRRAT